jgi:hypothetical protein
MQQEKDIRIGHAVPHKQDRASQRVGTKPDIKRGIEREAIEKVSFRQNE